MNRKEAIIFLAALAAFAGASALTIRYAPALEGLVRLRGAGGMAAYLLLEIASIVVLPVTTIPLLPAAVVLWGSFLTAVLNIAGWTAGSILAFWLARRFGRPVISRFVSMRQVERFEKYIPEKNMFWTVVFLRMAVPVDILSYALGLFGRMPMRQYALASFIGIVPFAVLFSYSVVLPFWFQIVVLILAASAVFLGYRKMKANFTSNNKMQ